MSSRAIRRLRQEQQELSLPHPQDDNDNDSEEEDDEKAHPKGGLFLDMLDEDDDSEEESSEEEEDSDDDDGDATGNARDIRRQPPTKPSKEVVSKSEEEDIDAILSSFHDASVPPTNEDNVSQSAILTLRSLLLSPSHGYDIQALDLDHAVKSLLGGAVVGAVEEGVPRGARGRNARGGRGNTSRMVKKYLFGRPREAWGKPPSYVGGGLGCKELTEEVLQEERHSWSVPWPYNQPTKKDDTPTCQENNNNESTLPKQKWYTLSMSDTYQEQQYAYQQLLRTRNTHNSATLEDPNALAMFVADHPHFADTLLQLSMVLYHVNDRGKGNDLLRRTMYLFETALPSSVLPNSSATATATSDNENDWNILMDIDRQPNQGFFATLFRIMQTSGMTGCHPNALMTGRYLLSLDPLRDPMGVLLILDYYALACRSSVLEGNEMGAAFIRELVESDLIKVHYKDPLTDRHWVCGLRDMPGWAFSYALALYRLGNNEDCEDEDMQQKADEALVDAFTKFPAVLPKLLAMNKVNTQDRSFIMDWPKVLPYFTADSDDVSEGSVQDRVTKGAGVHLVRIYVQRNHKLWAADDIVQWMYRCADTVVETMNKGSVSEEDKKDETTGANTETGNSESPTTPQSNEPHLTSKFHPALARYAQFDPSEYEDSFRTLPPEAIALNPNIIAPAMELNPNRRGRFLRRGQMPEEMQMEEGQEGLMMRLREALGMGEDVALDMLDPDSPLLQLYLQSLLPWNQVDGVRPPR